MEIEGVVDAIIDLVNAELIAKTDLTADALTGDTTISVENSFHFHSGQEIILIDWGYNDEKSSHYQVYEYLVVKSIIDTETIELTTPVISNWLVSDQSFAQKTIGHSPLYDHNVLYGDREVIPTDEVAITVEPVTVSNEWIYLQGGLSEESRLSIFIYGQSVETEEGMRILNKYTKAVYDLLNNSLHININDYQAPLTGDVMVDDTKFCVCDNKSNREIFAIGETITLQDNKTPRCVSYEITNRTFSAGEMCLTTSCAIREKVLASEFGIAIKMNRYFYDSRIDNVTFGVTQKSSAVLRAAELSWFGKEVNELSFPQYDRKTICFDKDDVCDESSSG